MGLMKDSNRERPSKREVARRAAPLLARALREHEAGERAEREEEAS